MEYKVNVSPAQCMRATHHATQRLAHDALCESGTSYCLSYEAGKREESWSSLPRLMSWKER